MRSISWTFSGFFCGGVLVGGFPGMRAPEKDIRDGLLVPHSTSAPSEIARWLGQEVEDSVVRCGWELFSFVFMPNHFYLFLRTLRPNLGESRKRHATFAFQLREQLCPTAPTPWPFVSRTGQRRADRRMKATFGLSANIFI